MTNSVSTAKTVIFRIQAIGFILIWPLLCLCFGIYSYATALPEIAREWRRQAGSEKALRQGYSYLFKRLKEGPVPAESEPAVRRGAGSF